MESFKEQYENGDFETIEELADTLDDDLGNLIVQEINNIPTAYKKLKAQQRKTMKRLTIKDEEKLTFANRIWN